MCFLQITVDKFYCLISDVMIELGFNCSSVHCSHAMKSFQARDKGMRAPVYPASSCQKLPSIPPSSSNQILHDYL